MVPGSMKNTSPFFTSTLFNTSSRAFDIFYQTKGRICKNIDNTFPINILILFPISLFVNKKTELD